MSMAIDLIRQGVEELHLLLKAEDRRSHMRHEPLIQGEIIRQIDGELGRNIAHEFLHEMTEEHTIIVSGSRFLQLRSKACTTFCTYNFYKYI